MLAEGFKAEDYEEEPLGVWAENWEAVAFFIDCCGTQWRHGFGGPTGLDYTAVLAALRTLRLPRDRFQELYADVRTLERAALEEMARE